MPDPDLEWPSHKELRYTLEDIIGNPTFFPPKTRTDVLNELTRYCEELLEIGYDIGKGEIEHEDEDEE